MEKIANELSTAVDKFVGTMKPIIITMGLVISVVIILFCGYKVITSKKAEDRAEALINVYTVFLGLGLIGAISSILGFLYGILDLK